MELQEAIKIVEDMPEDEFQAWYKSLPYRTRLCVQGGLVDWREILGKWYISTHKENVQIH